MNWTLEQSRAINENGNLLVSAAAGSGKTAVLTERIVRLITEGASPEDFLVVTFTKAAAAEMKKRIEKKLLKCAAESAENDDISLAKRLNNAAACVANSNISTIHSFCTSVLRRHFNAAGLDPAFRVGDETETAVLKQDVLEQVIEEYYEKEDNQHFISLTELLGGDEILSEAAQQLFEFMHAQPEPFTWLKNAIQAYCANEETLEYSDANKELLNFASKSLNSQLVAYCAVRDDYAKTDNEKLVSFMDEEAMRVRALTLLKTYPEFSAALESFEFVPARNLFKQGTDAQDKIAFQSVRDKGLKPLIDKLAKLFSSSLKNEAQKLNEHYPEVCELGNFMQDFISAFSEAKSSLGIIDYSDMEHITLAILKNELIANEYKSKFKYIFVDEYQDSNRVQESILNYIKREDNLFLVGDVKQSIYGFRLAEPMLFTEKYDLYKNEAFGKRIDLNANFRSSNAVIDKVNEIFSIIMHKEDSGIEYDENVALKPGIQSPSTGNVEMHIIDKTKPIHDMLEVEDGEDSANLLTTAEAEARVAAARIRRIIAEEEYHNPLTGEVRPYRYSDFVILHHSPKNVAQFWVETLASEGIPALAEHGGSYFDAIEVQIFMNLLRIIDNRRQDIPLISVLRSPIGGFSTEDLIRLMSKYRTKNDDFSAIDALTLCAQSDTTLGNKCKKMLANIDKWHKQSKLYSLCDFLNMLLGDTHFYEYTQALCGGEIRSANIDALIIRAQNFSANTIASVSSFITYMDKANKHMSSTSAALGDADVVSVMSIHKSKGLEYPIVILAGLDTRFGGQDERKPILLDSDLGLGFRFTKDNIRFSTFYRKAISIKASKKETAERMRLLYVAMTRAKEQLILVGALKDAQKRFASASPILTPERAMNAHTFLDWLMYLKIQPHFHASLSASHMDNSLDETRYAQIAAAMSQLECDYTIDASPFSWSYPHMEATKIPSKLSVSLVGGNSPVKDIRPYFATTESDAAAPLKRGTATHTVMERISIMHHTQESIANEIALLVKAGHITQEEAELVNIQTILGFFESNLGKRLLSSNKVERELKFNHRIKASKILDAPENETLLLQGMIDCCFIENEEWILVDYKTDYVPYPSEKEETAQKHAQQLSLYADALFALTGIPVKEKYIYFLRLKDGAVKL